MVDGRGTLHCRRVLLARPRRAGEELASPIRTASTSSFDKNGERLLARLDLDPRRARPARRLGVAHAVSRATSTTRTRSSRSAPTPRTTVGSTARHARPPRARRQVRPSLSLGRRRCEIIYRYYNDSWCIQAHTLEVDVRPARRLATGSSRRRSGSTRRPARRSTRSRLPAPQTIHVRRLPALAARQHPRRA